ncbi:MAG: prolipoprotein diacylglyceryl transferase [Acidimicrobiia bacterium]|nr:prolipoprotein diacylglyceryl transferase [Acidimicrobiia bacterium]
MEFSLLGAAAIGVGVLYAVLWWEAKRGNAAACTKDLWDLALGSAAAGLVVGRLATMIGNGVNPAAHLGDIIIVRAGVDTGWASLTALAVLSFMGRGEIRAVADGLAAAVLAGLAGWHGSCLFRDACLGTPSDLPWATSLDGSTVTRHPTEIYAALGFLAIAALLLAWKLRPPTLGLVGATALAAAGAIRLVTEPLRPALGGRPNLWYAAAIIAGAGSAMVLTARARRTRGKAPLRENGTRDRAP